MEAGVITLISVAVNALAAVFAPIVARKLARQHDNIRRAEETCALLGTGIEVLEQAVEENKDALSRTGAGNQIAQSIRVYGPAARQLVDAARTAAHHFRESAAVAYEQRIIRRERRERAEREKRAQ